MRYALSAVVAVLLAWLTPAKAADIASLAGEWRFAIDTHNQGVGGEWLKTPLTDTIQLPGTTDEGHKGTQSLKSDFTNHLSRVFPYAGAAWYQRDIVIPDAWKDKRISLFIERTKNSRVWVDQAVLGEQDSLAAPHVYEIGGAGDPARRLAPGRHQLTICIDNARRPPVNGGHQLSDDTQTNWNGILGRIELQSHRTGLDRIAARVSAKRWQRPSRGGG